VKVTENVGLNSSTLGRGDSVLPLVTQTANLSPGTPRTFLFPGQPGRPFYEHSWDWLGGQPLDCFSRMDLLKTEVKTGIALLQLGSNMANKVFGFAQLFL